jgi:4-hydroxybenzoate polyprenyltransferase
MLAGLRILAAVVVYRLKKLEMANMAGAASIALALRLSFTELLVRAAFVFGLNALVYLNNDYMDVAIDLKSSDKDAGKSRYLADNLGAALWAQWLLVGLLAAVALLWDWGLLVPLIAGGGICWWYSAQLKHMPYVDILAMMVWGVTMPLAGSPLDNLLGLAMALLLGLISGVFESIQVMRDADEDAIEGVRTTGVVLGKARTLVLAKVLMVATSTYALLYLQPIAAAIGLLALVIPFDPGAVERYWTRVKLVYGVAWLVICGWVFVHGESAGILAAIRPDFGE